ncbi:MAG: hypothetical protein WC082_11405 [Victivallales bacterium]
MLDLTVTFMAFFSFCAGQITGFEIPAAVPRNKTVKFVLRVPEGFSENDAKNYKIMVLFGGRNWTGERTIKVYNFVKPADKYKLFLLSPSFINDNYWNPEKWSGEVMLRALEKVKIKYSLNKGSKIIYFGYSAGAQCAALFYHWKPDIVLAWGVYACGVWFSPEKKVVDAAPALVTCGEEDEGRYLLSRRFVRSARERGYSVIWRSYPAGHGLSSEALRLAESFFSSILSGKTRPEYVGDDQEMKFYPAENKNGRNIDIEYRNSFFSLETARLWRGY